MACLSIPQSPLLVKNNIYCSFFLPRHLIRSEVITQHGAQESELCDLPLLAKYDDFLVLHWDSDKPIFGLSILPRGSSYYRRSPRPVKLMPHQGSPLDRSAS